jgi:hypothetical protein
MGLPLTSCDFFRRPVLGSLGDAAFTAARRSSMRKSGSPRYPRTITE